MVFSAAVFCCRIRAFATSNDKVWLIGGTSASFSRTGPATALYAPRIFLRLLFWRTSSCFSERLHSVADPCGEYQTLAPYVRPGRTTAVYISFAFSKPAPHVDWDTRFNINSYDVYLSWIFLMWGPHLSFESTWTPRILTESLASGRTPSILGVAVISNFLDVLEKCITSYLSGANFTSCFAAHCEYLRWISFSLLQFSAVIRLYVSTFMSSTKPTADVRKLSQLTVSSRFAMKNRNMIGELGDPCGIPLRTSNFSDSPSNVLIVVERFWRKLSIQRTRTADTLRSRRL